MTPQKEKGKDELLVAPGDQVGQQKLGSTSVAKQVEVSGMTTLSSPLDADRTPRFRLWMERPVADAQEF